MTLEERVAKYLNDRDCGPEAHCLNVARAIIPLVLDEAAKVVDGCAPNNTANDLKAGWAYGVAKSAATIRAIGAP